MTNEVLKIRGARTHNLKNVNLDIPKGKLITFTGVSGSGKSSLAFDTIYAEGQRRYVESLSTYARQFLGVMSKPDVDLIEGLSPAISIDQKTVSHNPRSTVGTVTEIYDYLRLLFARIGHPHCPICGQEISSQSVQEITEKIFELTKKTASANKVARIMIMSPVVKDRKGEFVSLFENIKSKGYKRVRVDGQIKHIDDDFVLIKTNKHSIDAVIDRISVSQSEIKGEIAEKNLKGRIADSVSQALKLSDGLVIAGVIKDASLDLPDEPKNIEDHLFSEKFSCPKDNIELPEIEPRTFSFNSPHGACEACTGLGEVLTVDRTRILAPLISVKEGAIVPFATMFDHDTWYSRLVEKVAEVHGINLSAPFKDIPEEHQKILLEGTGDREYKVDGKNKKGRDTFIVETFSGFIKELERRYQNTESDYIKYGIEKYMKKTACESCGGKRLKKQALSITIDGKSIAEVTEMPIIHSLDWTEKLTKNKTISDREQDIAKLILKEITTRLKFLEDVGLDYLNLARPAGTLAGGEAQRIRLASQIGSGLTGVLYILDEPTIGLHPRDNKRLIGTLQRLSKVGNTVIVVEHDKDVMLNSDTIYDFGPEAGKHGGTVVAEGTVNQLKKDSNSKTGLYLSGKRKIAFSRNKINGESKHLKLVGASQFNLKNIQLDIPLGNLVAVTGVSGSGKSTLIVETLYHAAAKEINRAHKEEPGKFDRLEGVDNLDKVVLIDQSPIGRTPRSNPATYTKVFDHIRDVFTQTRTAKANGFKKGRFSFNVKGGRCETCEGQGQIKIEMQFMPDIWVPCEVCKGARYNTQTLEVEYKGKNIADVLALTVDEAAEFFHVSTPIINKLKTLQKVGLGYIELGQPATTLSGGEAQRIKLASELAKRDTGNTLYILDEPTTGLHFADLEKLLAVLKILVERGNTVIVIEHNLDVIKNADWIVDLGPEGGDFGGKIIAEGPPEKISKTKNSHTAKFLSTELKR